MMKADWRGIGNVTDAGKHRDGHVGERHGADDLLSLGGHDIGWPGPETQGGFGDQEPEGPGGVVEDLLAVHPLGDGGRRVGPAGRPARAAPGISWCTPVAAGWGSRRWPVRSSRSRPGGCAPSPAAGESARPARPGPGRGARGRCWPPGPPCARPGPVPAGGLGPRPHQRRSRRAQPPLQPGRPGLGDVHEPGHVVRREPGILPGRLPSASNFPASTQATTHTVT